MAETPRTTGKKAGSRSPRKKTTPRAASATPKTPRTRATPPRKKATTKARKPAASAPPISLDERRRMISEAAFYKAASRGFVGGSPDRDWLEAEAEIDAMLLVGPAEDA